MFPVVVTAAFAVGLVVGRFWGPSARVDVAFAVLLDALILAVGFAIGSEEGVFANAAGSAKLVAISLLSAYLGSAAAGLLVAAAGGSIEVALLSSLGLGWYSFTGPLLERTFGAQAGAFGFIANVVREAASIVLMPALARLGTLPAVVAGGAASMDTVLPVIEKYRGSEAALLAFAYGLIVTALVAAGLPLLAGVMAPT